MTRTMLATCLLLMLAACGGHSQSDADKDAAQTPPKREKTVFDDQLKAIDKAKGVEAQLQKEKEQQDRAIDAQEKGDGGG
jgi:protein involved in sex pheromone biosynthesis